MRRLLVILACLATPQVPVVTVAGDQDAARALGLSSGDVTLLRSRSVLGTFPARLVVPELFNTYPLPQTFKVNADAHDDLRAQGLRELDIGIGEQVGAWQAEGGGFWFGKAIYNAEGERGRGGIGFLSGSGAYTFLDIPVVQRWSVTALIVETDTIWAALVNNGERLDTSGGLLEYDRKTKRVTIHAVTAVIHSMVRLKRQMFLGTEDGPFVWKNNALTRIVWPQRQRATEG